MDKTRDEYPSIALRRLVLGRAGIDIDSLPLQPKTDDEFWSLLETLADIKFAKERDYGDYVATQSLASPRLAMYDHFINIRRKFIRAESIANRVLDREATPDELIDTYADMAVYAILGVLLAWKLKGMK